MRTAKQGIVRTLQTWFHNAWKEMVLTESKMLLEANTNEDETEHIYEQMYDTSM